MSDAVRELEPKALWNNFADLNEIPRLSKKEERVIEAGPFGILSLKESIEEIEIRQGVYIFYRENVQIPLSGSNDKGLIFFKVADLGKDPASCPE